MSGNLVSAAVGFVYSPVRRDEHLLAFRKCWLLCAELRPPSLRESHAQINYSMTVNGFDVDGTDIGAFSIADKEPLIDGFAHSLGHVPRSLLFSSFSTLGLQSLTLAKAWSITTAIYPAFAVC